MPVDVTGLTDAETISAGYQHSCAVRSSGQAVCWGYGSTGLLGNGGPFDSNVPVNVIGLTDAETITAGDFHSCAIRTGGQAVCWGYASLGVLGNGNNGSSDVPVNVIGLTDAERISAGSEHTCATRADGQTVCWGIGGRGRLGYGSTANRSTPAMVLRGDPALPRSLSLTLAGPGSGEVSSDPAGIDCGTTCTADFLEDTEVTLTATADTGSMLVGWSGACAGHGSTCVVNMEQARDVTAWFGPSPLGPTLTDAATISAGKEHSCAIRKLNPTDVAGQAVCWGRTSDGRLGDNGVDDRGSPALVKGMGGSGLLDDVVSISAGESHSCAIREGGQAVCWGSGNYGELGNGSNDSSNVPVNVTGLTDAKAISAGDNHSCAIRAGGQAVCWGNGGIGLLGNGSNDSSNVPVNVTGLTDAKTISSGIYHNCAIRAGGQAVCWGYGGFGVLGNGSNDSSNVPANVTGLTDTKTISAGYRHSCAIREGGQAVCWGSGHYGELGNGSNTDSNVPVNVTDLTDAETISAGYEHNCAIRAGGQAVCWGNGGFGVLGNGSNDSSNVPVNVTGLTDAETISAGGNHSCAIRAGRQAVCWGHNNGQLGQGSTTSTNIPVMVLRGDAVFPRSLTLTLTGPGSGEVNSDPAGIDCGTTCTADFLEGTEVTLTATPDPGSIFAGWSGACAGRGTTCVVNMEQARNIVAGFAPSPPGPTLIDAATISAGNEHTCAIRKADPGDASGQAVCWGRTSYGRLGDDGIHDRATPVLVKGVGGSGLLDDAVSISAGNEHSCAIRISGQAVCWGHTNSGQLGDGSNSDSGVPVEVTGLTDAETIAAGGSHSCAIRTGGQAVCWGLGDSGQLGNDSNTGSNVPVNVTGLTDTETISAGGNHSCAIRTGGQAVCWGLGDSGQLGNDSNTGSNVPVNVTGLTDTETITAGGNHSCAIRTGGQTVCWGNGVNGRLGNGDNAGSPVPVNVNDLTDAETISAGGSHSCAIRENGQAVCWGYGANGRLGNDGSTSNVPVDVTGLTDAEAIAAGGVHSCAIRTDDQTVCWGFGGNAQLGYGSVTSTSTPVMVLHGALIPYRLGLTRAGTGEGEITSDPAGIDCDTDCAADFGEGTEVTLTAGAASGSTFTGWSGACSGSSAGCTVTMDQARQVTASFERILHQLTVTRAGNGQGTVTSNPAGINCGAACTTDYPEGTTVTLTASAAGNSVFKGWSGACDGTGPSCTVTVSQARQVTATFGPEVRAVFDGKRVVVRLKCGPQYRPLCRMKAVPVTRRGKKGVPMAKAVTRKIRSGNWIRTGFLIKPKYRKKLAAMTRKKTKQLVVRLRIRSKRTGKKPRTAYHHYVVLRKRP